jgi:hypothetical protein
MQIRLPAEEEMFNTKVFGLDLGPRQPPAQWVAGLLSSGVNGQGPEYGHLAVIVAEFRNKWRYNFTP